ncbi:aldo/keto reductase [Zunongwangia sp. F260]|uniref:Aldo/keto reductase n=1 Tax=Autumnicola lenta TaxID=3075593 RepID=A0ABU3CNM1_9FLAO|nr:aldo/keto reductase [Zunongwangia sp. F260]MDT0647959.1 aldo/keto reductase [Zunongwangia sp. F260]
MTTRRDFIYKTMLTSAATVAAPATVFASGPGITSPLTNENMLLEKFRPKMNFGMGGVGAGNGFHVNSDEEIRNTMEAAWNNGVRHFDTSPWYGLGISERRMGSFLFNKNREDYILSSKIGRILKPAPDFEKNPGIWKGKLNFDYAYDYSAEGVRKSVEDTLHRMGLSSLDIVYIHDLSPDNGDMKEDWVKYFEVAQKGAMPELIKMREEGLIKGWGFGVNTIEPILKAIEVSDPDIFLSATQYSLMHHKDALNKLFPVCEKEDISLMIGAPLNAGFLAGKDRYNYSEGIPDGFLKKREKMNNIAQNHGVDLRSAALQFSAAPKVVASVIPGASKPYQSSANAKSMSETIPEDFWKELKSENLIAQNAPEPQAS